MTVAERGSGNLDKNMDAASCSARRALRRRSEKTASPRIASGINSPRERQSLRATAKPALPAARVSS